MSSTLQSTQTSNVEEATLLNPLDIIDKMIELRIQLQELDVKSRILLALPLF